MKRIEIAHTYDDVTLVERGIAVERESIMLESQLAGQIIRVPIISAPMDTLTDGEFAIAMAREGGVGIIHKNMTITQQKAEIKKFRSQFPKGKGLVGAAISVGRGMVSSPDEEHPCLARARALVRAGADILVVDTGHGHSRRVLDAVRAIKEALPKTVLIAGNVATPEGTIALIEAGADIIKVGVGGGSICTTRQVAGVGCPQLTAVSRCATAARARGVPVIADGGIRNEVDIIKSLVAGADWVMLGSYLAATREAIGETVTIDGQEYKYYRGMGSEVAMRAGAADRYGQEGSVRLVPEGIEGYRRIEGSLAERVEHIRRSITDYMQQCGATRIVELPFKSIIEYPEIPRSELILSDVLMLPQYTEIIPPEVRIHTKIADIRLVNPIIIHTKSGAENQIARSLMCVPLMDIAEIDYTQPLPQAVRMPLSDAAERALPLISLGIQFYFLDPQDMSVLKIMLEMERLRQILPPEGILIIEGIRDLQQADKLLASGNLLLCIGSPDTEGVSVELIEDVANLARARGGSLLVRGNITTSGDLAKALALGACAVVVEQLAVEPEEYERQLYQYIGGLSSGMAYCGAIDIENMQKNAVFIGQTSAGRRESRPHTVIWRE